MVTGRGLLFINKIWVRGVCGGKDLSLIEPGVKKRVMDGRSDDDQHEVAWMKWSEYEGDWLVLDWRMKQEDDAITREADARVISNF